MPSFEAVNYSLRPSKTIQRQLVFEGVRRLRAAAGVVDQVYIGFGSIWFTDFVTVHRTLGIDEMISIEGDDVGYQRARYNAPYKTVRVEHGRSSAVLPALIADPSIAQRPWLVWLDYDSEFTEEVADDIQLLAEKAPANTMLLVTFNGRDDRYGQAVDRLARLKTLFGSIVPDDLPKRRLRAERMHETLADLAMSYVQGVVGEAARPGGFVPAFRMIYRDTAPMVTVGGILPAPASAAASGGAVSAADWSCFPPKPIVAPHLTVKETSALQTQLPRVDAITRTLVKTLGFDLEDDQIEAFQTYYRQYPAFAQILL